MKKFLLLSALTIIFFSSCKKDSTTSSSSDWIEVGGANALSANDFITSIESDKLGNIYAYGNFTNSNAKHYVAKWNGNVWSQYCVVDSTDLIGNICVDNLSNVYVACVFNAPNTDASYVKKWDGTSWSILSGLNAQGSVIIRKDVNNNIYAFGGIYSPNGKHCIKKWNGTTWAEVGGANSLPDKVIITDLCSDKNSNLYIAGILDNSTNTPYVGKFNGTSWQKISTGLNAGNPQSIALRAVNVDNNGAVYVAGNISNPNGNTYVAKWNGSTWGELGGNNSCNFNGTLVSIISDGLNNIYTSGHFVNGNGNNYVAKFDGLVWSELGGANSLAANNPIYSLTFDATNKLYASGYFTNSSGKYFIAKYNK